MNTAVKNNNLKMKNNFFEYNLSYKEQVYGTHVPQKLFSSFTNESILYKLLHLMGVYQNYFFLLSVNNAIVGSILLRRRVSSRSLKKWWWIYGVFVDKKYRGEGYGKVLIQQSLNWLKNSGANEVFLYVNKNNMVAKNLYLNYGFVIISESKYHKIKSDQCLMKYIIH
jgi:ribosomal protein S18 acetylase RimI-like enzyme